MKTIRITSVSGSVRDYKVEVEVADKLLSSGTKLSETRTFKDSNNRRHAIMMANIVEIEEVG